MPRRRRPPLTTREIAAYLAGSRLRRAWADACSPALDWGSPSQDWVLERLAAEDAEVCAAMKPKDWWAYFWNGFNEAPK